MAMQGNFTKSKVMVFHPKEGELQRAGEGPPERLDQAASPLTRSASIVPRRSVPGRRIMAGTRAKGACKDASSHGYWRPLLSCSSLPTKVRLVQTFIYSAVMYGAEVWDTTKAVKDKMSAVVKKALAAF
jgi:hypothetical protein